MSYTYETKPSNTWTDNLGYLLTQALGYLQLENGGKIILDQSNNAKPLDKWSYISK